MKKKLFAALACLLCSSLFIATPARAQEWSLTVGADATSSYLWRGYKLADPSIQPNFSFDYEGSAFSLSAGLWGTKDFTDSKGYKELDAFVSATKDNFTLSLTDYCSYGYFDKYDNHALDLTLSYTLGEELPLTFAWSSIVLGGDHKLSNGNRAFSSYFEAGYDFSLSVIDFNATVGMVPFTSPYYEEEGFNFTNLSLKAGHEFEFDFGGTVPVAAQFVYNPSLKECYFGVSAGFYFTLGL